MFGEYIKFMKRQLQEIMREMQGVKFVFATNVRGDELEMPNYYDDFMALIIDGAKTRSLGKTQYRIQPSLNKIEILEDRLAVNNLQVLANLKKFQEVGVSLSLDDFYTKDSGRDRLKALYAQGILVREIKLDGKYIADLEEEYQTTGRLDRAKADIREIRSYAHPDCIITLEKVENKFQAQLAQLAGVDEIQGWYYAKLHPAKAYNQDRTQRLTRQEGNYRTSVLPEQSINLSNTI